MWNVPGPGIKPVSPALAGGFLTTHCQGSPGVHVLMQCGTVAETLVYFHLFATWGGLA